MGYWEQQTADLVATIAKAGEGGVEAVAVGTPIDLQHLIEISLPVTRVRYDLELKDGASMAEILEPVVSAARKSMETARSG